jgi:hypothetical protein
MMVRKPALLGGVAALLQYAIGAARFLADRLGEVLALYDGPLTRRSRRTSQRIQMVPKKRQSDNGPAKMAEERSE